jgi:uncharacterized membrane-anchored protein YitT (DUF2179 family)
MNGAAARPIGAAVRSEALPMLGIALGTLVIAAGLNLFLIPNRLNDGGLTAVAVVLHYVAHVPVGATLFVINLPLFALSAWRVGLTFAARSLLGTFLLSLWLSLVPERAVVHDLLLATVYGGLVSGIGTGLVFRFGGSTGGTDLVARLVRLALRWTSGRSLLAVDVAVIALTGIVLGARLAMYSAFALFVGTRVVDALQEGSEGQKLVLVVSSQGQAVADRVGIELGRGATGLPGRGMYSGQGRDVVLIALTRGEIARLKDIVAHEDAGAFMLVLPAGEVLGEGFAEFRVRGTSARLRGLGASGP